MAENDLNNPDTESKEFLEKQELKAKITKLKKESQILDNQLTAKFRKQETIKAYGSLAGVVAAIIAVQLRVGVFTITVNLRIF